MNLKLKFTLELFMQYEQWTFCEISAVLTEAGKRLAENSTILVAGDHLPVYYGTRRVGSWFVEAA